MPLETKSYSTILADFGNAVQSAATKYLNKVLDFSIGSIVRAMGSASAGVTLWIQGLIVTLLSSIRLATSSGTDVDTFIADFGLTRLAAAASSGFVTFFRYNSAYQASIPVGQIVSSAGNLQFAVVADTTNSYFDLASQTFIIPAGISSINVKVICQTAGIIGNVAINQINIINTPIPFVDTVTNANAFVNGADPETDSQVKTRFVLYINSLSKATLSAVKDAIMNVREGIEYAVVENKDYDTNSLLYGYFYNVIDDGTGHPTTDLLQSVYNAVDAVRPISVRFGVYPADPIVVNVTATLLIDNMTYSDDAVTSAVNSTVSNYIESVGIGNVIYYTKLESIIYSALPDGIYNVSSVLLNGGTVDITSDSKHSFIVGTISLTVVHYYS